jgi:HEAT repeat protein
MFGSKLEKVEKAVTKKNHKALIELVGSSDKEVSIAALSGLGKMECDDASNCLIQNLHNKDAQLRGAAAAALGDMGDMHAKAHISAQMAKETDAAAKDAMSKAMARIKGY